MLARVPATAAGATPPLKVNKKPTLLAVVAHHALSHCDLQLACDLSDLLRESISAGCRSTYACGLKSLSDFCKAKNLCALPVDAVTLCAWMMVKCKTIKVKSVIKYTCGIRYAHVLEGFEWKLNDHPLVKTTIKSLKKKYPTSSVLQKVPLSLSLLLRMCQGMDGWPSLQRLSFNDLTWATASCIAFFAALRGGEFFVQPKGDRPLLTGGAVNLRTSPTGPYVYIDVPLPKTRQDLKSIPAMAVGTNGGFSFDPVRLLNAYRIRAVAKSINVLGSNAAFKTDDGRPIDRHFMVSRAERLRDAAKIVILNTAGSPIKVSAASWRAGFVLSARQAGVLPETIRNNGRWTSVGGPMPYTVDTIDIFQSMATELVKNHTERTRKGAGAVGPSAGGQFVSSSLLL